MTQKFFFRRQIMPCESKDDQEEVVELTMAEVMCGKGEFAGLIPLTKTYLDMIQCDQSTRKTVDGYLNFIQARARGELMTAATFLRKYALMHPDYKKDSKLTQKMVYDIVETVDQIAKGKINAPQLVKRPEALPDDPQKESTRGPYLRGAHVLRLPNKQGCQIFRSFLTKYLPQQIELQKKKQKEEQEQQQRQELQQQQELQPQQEVMVEAS